MEMKQFVEQIESSKDFTGVSMISEGDEISGVVVRHNPTKVTTKLPISVIKQIEWGDLHDLMSGKREPTILQHMTRVVGYYSKIANWNPSKIGELKDRQAGNYHLDD